MHPPTSCPDPSPRPGGAVKLAPGVSAPAPVPCVEHGSRRDLRPAHRIREPRPEPGFLRRRGPELGLGHPRTAGICGAGQLRHPDLRTGPHPLERLGVLPDWEENSCLFSGRTAASEASLRGRGSRRRQREARPLVRAGGGLLLEPPPPSWHHRAVLLPRGGRLRSPLQPPGQACRLMCCRTREWG